MISRNTRKKFTNLLMAIMAASSLLLPLLSATPVAAAACTSTANCLSQMTLAEKIGQMTQVEEGAFSPCGANPTSDIAAYSLGSLLSGGGGGPNCSTGGTASQWYNMVTGFQNVALTSRLGIPIIYGVDAVHGHNNVAGSTIFPHHIGMGAAHDTALITQAEQATRDEVLGTGIRWTFGRCLCGAQDAR